MSLKILVSARINKKPSRATKGIDSTQLNNSSVMAPALLLYPDLRITYTVSGRRAIRLAFGLGNSVPTLSGGPDAGIAVYKGM